MKDILLQLSQLGVSNEGMMKIRQAKDRRVFQRSPDFLSAHYQLTPSDLRKIQMGPKELDYLLERLGDLGISYVVRFEEDYPESFETIPDPPEILFYKGQFEPEDAFAVAIIGARKSTSYGRWAATKFARELSEYGIPVISGLAYGIDSSAQYEVLKRGGRTIGFAACGLDIHYPRSSRRLYEEIPQNGLLLSEHFPGMSPLKYHFPKRNRLIAAYSKAVLLIEATLHSGTYSTAEFAANLGRPVYALPGNIDRETSQGTNEWIARGAFPLLDISSVLEEVLGVAFQKEQVKAPLNDVEEKLYEFIRKGVRDRDELILKTGLSPQIVMTYLTALELKDYIQCIDMKIYLR